MAQDRTSGFDMLVQVSETELNTQLATAFLAGTIIPAAMAVPINQGGIVGTGDLNFGTPTVDLDRPRPRIGLTIPFVNSQLSITAPAPMVVAPLGGQITIVDQLEVLTIGSSQVVTLDFNNGAPDVTVEFDVASQALLAPLLAAAGLSLLQAQNMMAGAVLAELQTGVRRIDLSGEIPAFDDADPTLVFDMAVTTVNDETAIDRDCMTVGLRMQSDSGGNINLATTNFIPTGSPALVMMSNFWLLARAMRPSVAAALGRPITDFDTPLRLNAPVPAPGGSGTLTAFEARVIGNRIRVEGRATASGTGWAAVSDFSFFVDLALTGTSITVTATAPTVTTDVDLEWWVWLLSLGLGGLFGGITGVIIAALVLATVEAVAGGVVSGIVGTGLGTSLATLAPVPLGPIGGRLTASALILDDLELRGSIVRTVSVPIKSQGQHTSFSGFSLDLDTGTINGAAAEADLFWDQRMGIGTTGGAGLTVTGASYYGLTPVQVSRMPLVSTAIPLSLMPVSEVVFGVRTSEGRYAKVHAWRSLTAGSVLHIGWVTYDTPTPRLDIAARWAVLERGTVTEYIRPDCAYCESSEVRRRGIFEAWPRLMTFPIDYEWCLCGTVLKEGTGEVHSPDGPLSYSLEGRHLEIETDLGQDVTCELCVSAIDARGHELFTCIQLSQRGTDVRCRKCQPTKTKYRTELVQPAAALANWRPLQIGFMAKAEDS